MAAYANNTMHPLLDGDSGSEIIDKRKPDRDASIGAVSFDAGSFGASSFGAIGGNDPQGLSPSLVWARPSLLSLMSGGAPVASAGVNQNAGNQPAQSALGGDHLGSAVSQLTQAMATVTASTLGFDPAPTGSASTSGLASNDPTPQGAIAAAWHH